MCARLYRLHPAHIVLILVVAMCFRARCGQWTTVAVLGYFIDDDFSLSSLPTCLMHVRVRSFCEASVLKGQRQVVPMFAMYSEQGIAWITSSPETRGVGANVLRRSGVIAHTRGNSIGSATEYRTLWKRKVSITLSGGWRRNEPTKIHQQCWFRYSAGYRKLECRRKLSATMQYSWLQFSPWSDVKALNLNRPTLCHAYVAR